MRSANFQTCVSLIKVSHISYITCYGMKLGRNKLPRWGTLIVHLKCTVDPRCPKFLCTPSALFWYLYNRPFANAAIHSKQCLNHHVWQFDTRHEHNCWQLVFYLSIWGREEENWYRVVFFFTGPPPKSSKYKKLNLS